MTVVPQILTYKIRLLPNEGQIKILWDLSEKNRLMYNFALTERKKQFEENKTLPQKERKYLTKFDQINWATKTRHEYPEYEILYASAYHQTMKKLDANYKSFFSLWKKGHIDARPPRYKGIKHFTNLIYNQSGWKFDHKHQKISFQPRSELDLNIKYLYQHKSKKPRRLKETDKIKEVEIINDKDEWFGLIKLERIVPKYEDNGKHQAFDPGNISLGFGVNLNGEFLDIKYKRFDQYWRKKIDEVKEKRDRCLTYWKHPNSDKLIRSHDNYKMSKKGHYPIKRSNKWNIYNNKIKSMSRKQTNQFRDYYHFWSKKIVQNTRANTIIWGDKDNKSLAKKKRGTGNSKKNKINASLNFAAQNIGQSKFVEFLTYKAILEGKKVIKIDERGTTKKCFVCGKKEDRKLSERELKCDCGNTMLRDANSACNIMDKFLLSHESPLSGVVSDFRETILRKTGLSSDNALAKNQQSGESVIVT